MKITRNVAVANHGQKTEFVAEMPQNRQVGERLADSTRRGENRGELPSEPGGYRQERQPNIERGSTAVQQQSGNRGGGRTPVKGIADFEVSANARRYISIGSLLLV